MPNRSELERPISPEDIIIQAGNVNNHIKSSILKRSSRDNEREFSNPTLFSNMNDQIILYQSQGFDFLFTSISKDLPWEKTNLILYPHQFSYNSSPWDNSDFNNERSKRLSKDSLNLGRSKFSSDSYHKYTLTFQKNTIDEPNHLNFQRMHIFIDDNGEGIPVISEPDPKYLDAYGDYYSDVILKGGVSQLVIPVDPSRYLGIMNTLGFILTR